MWWYITDLLYLLLVLVVMGFTITPFVMITFKPKDIRKILLFGSSIKVYCSKDDTVYPGQWKEFETNLTVKIFPNLFGKLRAGFEIDSELAQRRGLSLHYFDKRDRIVVTFFNHQDYPVRLRVGTYLGKLYFYKSTFFQLI
jgi:hypothetical protein